MDNDKINLLCVCVVDGELPVRCHVCPEPAIRVADPALLVGNGSGEVGYGSDFSLNTQI